MRIATYNIQYGIGLDGHYNIGRICEAVGDADIICLQEVTRGFIRNGGVDMAAAIESRFPMMFSSFHAATDIDMMSGLVDGRASNRRFQFGNMVLSRWPITAARGHLLPRTMRTDALNLQRGALEALIATPDGPLRVYSTHFDHIAAAERLRQSEALFALADQYALTGGAISGAADFGLPAHEDEGKYLLLGDFNFEPGSEEYELMISNGLVDVCASAQGWTWTEPKDRSQVKRLDHIFASPELAPRCAYPRIDQHATGSDHMPLWISVNA